MLPFVDLTRGKEYIGNFFARNKEWLRLGSPGKEAEQRWRACNAETLTNYVAMFESYLRKYNTDESRVYNLDETSITPNKDPVVFHPILYSVAKSRKFDKYEKRRSATPNRITLLAKVCADSWSFAPLFLSKVKRFRRGSSTTAKLTGTSRTFTTVCRKGPASLH